MPKVSVIIPTYNRAAYVTKAVESVLGQTYRDFEIIVVDDGSSDTTPEALRPYMNNIEYVRQENAGVSAARNAGILKASGEWVAFLDSDDEWMEQYLSAQMGQIEQYPEAVAHITNSVFIFVDGVRKIEHFDELGLLPKFKEKTSLFFQRPLCLIIDHSHWFLQPSIVRRKVLLKAGLFDTRLSIGEDLDLLARVALQGPFSVNKNVLVEIMRRQESIECLSSKWMEKGIYSRKTFCDVYLNILKQPGLTLMEKLTVERVLGTMWRALGNVLLKRGSKAEARVYYRKALFLCPSFRALIKYSSAFMPLKVSLLFVRKGKGIVPGEDPVEPAPDNSLS